MSCQPEKYKRFGRLMRDAGWQVGLGRNSSRIVYRRDGLTVLHRYVYLAYCWTGRLPDWAEGVNNA